MKSLIIIPAYNEEACIEQTVRDILEHAPNFDYIVINDCSKDRTKEICEKNQFHYIDLPVNLGIGGAVQTGYKYACNHGYDYAVQVDGDGQHDPRFLEQMLHVMQEKKLDMLIGSRFITKEGFQSSGLRRTGIKYFTWLIRLLTGKTITDTVTINDLFTIRCPGHHNIVRSHTIAQVITGIRCSIRQALRFSTSCRDGVYFRISIILTGKSNRFAIG